MNKLPRPHAIKRLLHQYMRNAPPYTRETQSQNHKKHPEWRHCRVQNTAHVVTRQDGSKGGEEDRTEDSTIKVCYCDY